MTPMVEGLTQDQVKDLVYMGAFHYEALLRDDSLIDDVRNIVKGTVAYPVWETRMLAEFGKINGVPLVIRYLPNAFIRSKATLLGALTLARAVTEFEPWRSAVFSDMTGDERTKVTPYLPEVFEMSRKLASEARARSQTGVSPPPNTSLTANHNQRIALITGGVIFVLMLLVPPWHYSSGRSWGYHLLFWPPPNSIFIDSTRLFVQCVLVATVTAGAFVLLRSKSN